MARLCLVSALFVVLPPSTILSLDCNGNGGLDVDDIQNGVSADCDDNGVPDECEGLPFEFALDRGVIFAAATPRVVRAADVNDDGREDLVVLSRSSRDGSVVSVALNRGNRTFSAAVEYSVGVSAYAVALGDFDGDSHVDLATASKEEIIVLQNDGHGQLERTASLPRPFDTRFVMAADVDGDGDADLLATNHASASISILENNGGTFEQTDDLETGESPESIATGDFNEDGQLDVVVLADVVSIFLNHGEGFASTNYEVGTTAVTGVVATDIDMDGDADLVVSSRDGLFFRYNNGDGTFGQESVLLSVGLQGVSAIDVDGDGDTDLALGTSRPSALTIRANDGVGGLGVSTSFDAPSLLRSLATADFDSNGQLDVAAVVNEGIRLFWGGESQEFTLQTELVQLGGCGDERGCRPHDAKIADIDSDGDLDVIGCNTHPGEFSIALNDGTGKLINPDTTVIFGGEHPQSVAIGDLDDDGDPDVVTTDNLDHQIYVHLNRGDATFESAATYSVGRGSSAPISAFLADFDDDGDLDAVSANQGDASVTVLFNQYDGGARPDASFSRPSGWSGDLDVGRQPKSITAADFDGDGSADIASANSENASVTIYYNDGEGNFPRRVDERLVGNPNHVTHGDVNGDGDLDLITANTDTSNCTIFLNDGDGGFVRPPVDVSVGTGPYSVIAVDFNRDGFLDVITGNETTSTVAIILGNGDGTFQAPTSVDVGRGVRFVSPGDLDKDGDIDIVTTDRHNRSFTAIYNITSSDTPDFQERICTAKSFHDLTASASANTAARRFLKFTMPASDRAELQRTVYQNQRRFKLHFDFLTRVFPDLFAGLTQRVYNDLIFLRESRQYFVGTVSLIPTGSGFTYGFSVFADWENLEERLTAAEVKGIFESLQESFHLGPLKYFPDSLPATRAAESWGADPGFPIYFSTGAIGGGYEAYTRTVGYGLVRLFDKEQFEAANESGQLSFREIVVIDHAPRDMEGVVAGVITSAVQGPLSHVAVRTNRRGTPNAFLKNALKELAEYENQFIRLEVGEFDLGIEVVSQATAEDFWEFNRPELSVVPTVDPDFTELSSLAEIAALEASGEVVEARFGGKASGLARLQTILDGERGEYQEAGFAIPVHYYADFMKANSLPSAFDESRSVSYQDYVGELLQSDQFHHDSEFRFEALENLREHIRGESAVPPELVERLSLRIAEVFGADMTTSRVRFRSSSNVEDAIEFNGAGLYNSTSVCPGDDLDEDDAGPSHCWSGEDLKQNERGIARGLRRVWSSLWNFRAFEERAFYGISQDVAAMGVLCNRAFVDERANGVAFTGNPANPRDRRYVITVQQGEESVVSPEPGVVPETDLLEMGEGGEVTRIIRALPSSLVPEGTFVLSDEELRELGALLWHMDAIYPVDPGIHDRRDLLLDIEFKIEQSGDLAVKQIRPFLLTNPEPAAPDFEIEIPANTVACGSFRFGRALAEEWSLKSTLHFVGDTYTISATVDSFTATIVEKVVIGQGREVAEPRGQGLFTVQAFPQTEPVLVGGRFLDDVVVYRLFYNQELSLSGGEPVDVELTFEFRARDGIPLDPKLVLDGEALTDVVVSEVTFQRGRDDEKLNFTSCTQEHLPIWQIRGELEDGSTVFVEDRYRQVFERDIGPASTQRAEIVIAGKSREVLDYYDLVYSAVRHNEHVEYWILLDSPIVVEGLEEPVHGVHLVTPELQESPPLHEFANYLGEDLQVLGRVEFTVYQEGFVTDALFRRGDVNGNGRTNVSDAIFLLSYLMEDDNVLPCEKAADAVDDGIIKLDDAVAILTYLFRASGPLPEPGVLCGGDPTPDTLTCEGFSLCSE